jgi:hypothetical protein
MVSMNILFGLDFMNLNLTRIGGNQNLPITVAIYFKCDFGYLPLRCLSLQVYSLWTPSRFGYLVKNDAL